MYLNQINFGENIRKIRSFRGYSQEYMSSKLGYKDHKYYSRLEASAQTPNMEIVKQLAQIFESPTSLLLSPEIRLLNSEDMKQSRIKLYSWIAYSVAILAGIVCADPAWQLVDGACEMMGVIEPVRLLLRVAGGFLPCFLFFRGARRAMKYYIQAHEGTA